MENNALDRLLRILKTSGADAWEVTDEREKGWEFYLIRHTLDQNRVRNLESFRVKVVLHLRIIMLRQMCRDKDVRDMLLIPSVANQNV